MTYDQWLNAPYEYPHRYDFSSGWPLYRGGRDEEEDGDVIDNFSESSDDAWEYADMACEEQRLARNRCL